MAASVAGLTRLPPASASSPQKALAGMAHERSAKPPEAPTESPYLPLEPQDDAQEAASEASAVAPLAAATEEAVDAPTRSKSKSKSKSKASSAKKKKAGGSKKKRVLENHSGAPCVGLYVDALDLKMLWGEAQIIDCNVEEKKLKVHFIGWKSSYDIWTDRMSVAGHGTFVPLTKKSLAMPRRWDGKSNLFSDTEEPQDDGGGGVFVPLLKESPQKKPEKQPAVANVSAAAEAPEAAAPQALPEPAPPAPESTAAEVPAVITPAVPRDAPTPAAPKAAPAVRKSRPSKLVIEKAKAVGAAGAPKRSPPPSKGERGGAAVTALTKVSPAPAAKVAPSASVSGKKRSKSPVAKSSGAAGDVAPPAPSRPHKRVKESVELQPANSAAAAVDLAAARQQNVAGDAQTANFLQRCAAVWQRQLSAVAARQS